MCIRDRLKGITEPEKKRKVIGNTFVEVFNDEISKLKSKKDYDFLAQGTLYPDVIESISIDGNPAALIKSDTWLGDRVFPVRMASV